jgi:hypothetical protein
LACGRVPIAGVATAARGELLTLQPPWHMPAPVSQFTTQTVKAWSWGWIEGRDVGTGGTVTVCRASRTGGPSSGVGACAHTTPRISTPRASLERTRTPYILRPKTYRILRGAVYTLWKRKHLATTIPVYTKATDASPQSTGKKFPRRRAARSRHNHRLAWGRLRLCRESAMCRSV